MSFNRQRTNGLGVIMVVSGGWFSAHEAINAGFFGPLLARGYTVFAVVHGSQPKFIITEIEQDMQRAVRFIRQHAREYGVNPDRLGITGGSAGGHLSLTMAVKGGNGDPAAKDPVERQSSAVQAVACFFPPTDFLNYSRPGDKVLVNGILKPFKAAFGPRMEDPKERDQLAKEISPIYFAHSNMPPALIIHGDADQLVPIYQAQTFVKRYEELGCKAELITRQGKVHGWPDMIKDMELFADWFDKYLR